MGLGNKMGLICSACLAILITKSASVSAAPFLSDLQPPMNKIAKIDNKVNLLLPMVYYCQLIQSKVIGYRLNSEEKFYLFDKTNKNCGTIPQFLPDK